jgi:hypothetical protein
MARACDGSLARLGTDYLDPYLLHSSVPNTEFSGVVAGFESLRAAGKIRAWGVSNFSVRQMEDLLRIPQGDRCATNQVSGHFRTKRRPTANLIICERLDRLKSRQDKNRPQSKRNTPQRRARRRILQNRRMLPFAYIPLQGICLGRPAQAGRNVFGISKASMFTVMAVRNIAFDTSFLKPKSCKSNNATLGGSASRRPHHRDHVPRSHRQGPISAGQPNKDTRCRH